jgi:serine/threonine-protein kinase
MLVARNQVQIMDFGVARMRVSDLKTSTGVVLGTPRYMSPEQVAGLPVDHRTDIFSLGIVLYEMLTGSPLFAGEDMPQIMHKVSKLDQAPPSRINPEVPPMLDFVLARALKKDPDVRYQDAYELAADLRSCLAELGGDVKKVKADDSVSTKTIKLDPGTAKGLHVAPAAGAIASDTLLPLSVRFDSSAAVQRLTSPKKRDQVLLARTPRPVGFWRRLIRDPRRRGLFAVVAAAALLGAFIAFA